MVGFRLGPPAEHIPERDPDDPTQVESRGRRDAKGSEKRCPDCKSDDPGWTSIGGDLVPWRDCEGFCSDPFHTPDTEGAEARGEGGLGAIWLYQLPGEPDVLFYRTSEAGAKEAEEQFGVRTTEVVLASRAEAKLAEAERDSEAADEQLAEATEAYRCLREAVEAVRDWVRANPAHAAAYPEQVARRLDQALAVEAHDRGDDPGSGEE